MKRYLKTIFGFMERLRNVGAFATQAAYFILLSFIPFLMLLLTLVQYIPPISDQKMVTDMLLQIMPDTGEFRIFLLGIISRGMPKERRWFLFLRFWLCGVREGIEGSYRWGECHLSCGGDTKLCGHENTLCHISLIFIIAVIGSLVLLVFGNSIQKLLTKYIPVLGNITAHVIGMRTAISLCILVCIFLLIYKFLPNRKASLNYQIPGAVSSAVAWSLFSLGFSFYLDYFDGMSNMYGSLTTIMLVMLWMYFCMCIVLIGAEINAYFEDTFPAPAADGSGENSE